ncbi:ATP-binding cassette transporter snq2 [Pichia californica]|nr:ATP-binding cassette transporter snq2 [[Candida] californica]
MSKSYSNALSPQENNDVVDNSERSSIIQDVNSFHPDEKYIPPADVNNNENDNDNDNFSNEIDMIHRAVTRGHSTEFIDTQNDVLTRLSTLSKTLSHLNAEEMKTFKIDPNDFDLQAILQFMTRRNEEQGLKVKTCEVIFKNLSINGKNTSASVVKDVGDVFFPIYSFFRNRNDKKKSSFDFSKLPKTRKIIKNVSGYASPGTMTLVLGRPGAGCSSFLKVLSGETKTYLGYEGEMFYGGINSNEMFKDHKNQLIYNPELDIHFPYLTVEQTMKFAIGCKTPSIRINNVSRDEYITTIKDLYLTLFGLKHVEKTLVGNDFVRGISGGQRKRVSIAEAMVTKGTVFCFDNATRGLDASTALEFTESLRTSTNITKTTSLVTIYQASENIYQLFDYVTVLYLGRQIYFGKIQDAVEYFFKMGYSKPNRQTTPEFLTAVTDPLARIYRPDVNPKDIPSNADEFEDYWLNSPEYAKLQNEIDLKLNSSNANHTDETFKEVLTAEKQKYTSKKSPYTVNFLQQLKLCCKRRSQNLINNKAYTITLVAAAIIQSLIIGSLYYNTTNQTVGAFSRGGILFFSCLYFCIMCLAETADLFQDKPILNKQFCYTMYQPSSELLAKQLVSFPVRCIAITAFSLIIYFLSNLRRDAGAFFSYFLFVNLVVQSINSLFTLMASLMPDLSAANGINGIVMMAMIVYSSYMIQRPSMYWWFKWFSYCNPVLYAFESLILMEFRGSKMPCSVSQLIPYGDSYKNINPLTNQVCGFVGGYYSKQEYNGENFVDGMIYLKLSFQYVWAHMWRNLGIMFCFLIGYVVINAILVEFYNPIVASSDKLLFIHGANIPSSLLEAIGASNNNNNNNEEEEQDSDPEKNLGFAKSNEKIIDDISESQHSSATIENGQKLGSDDIFMWQNVDYVVPYDGADRKLLDNVQGYVLPGTLTALMGESGAGKTTLLNVLSRRVDVGVVTGDTLINGKPIDPSFERRTGYVQQQDLHIAELTVRESLIFSARLRRPHSVPDEEKIQYVDEVIKILNMEEYVDSLTGQSGYGLNVEQRKKLSIATELVAKPSLLLFLDEPTSGLDSQSSWAIIQVLKELAKAGQAILCTIHQPSATLFEEFDKLLLLRRGGQTVYFGDIGDNSKTMIDYFQNQGGRPCSETENPAEYILEVIGAGATGDNIEDWNKKWIESKEYETVTNEIKDLISKTSQLPASDNTELTSQYAAPFNVQFWEVYKRTSLQFYRSLDYIMAKFMLFLLGGLLAGFSFWNVKHTVVGMQNVLFACFIAVVVSSPLINQIQEKAIAARELYEVRESKSNTFHWSFLMISQFLCEIPYSLAFSTIYFICWYFPIQLDNEASRCGMWWFTYCIFFQLYYISLGLAIVYVAPDLPSANVLTGLALNFIISFCGVVQVPSLMPGFWKFMWRLSPFTYFVDNFVSILLHDRPVVCSAEEYNILDPPNGMTCDNYLHEYFVNNKGYVNNGNATSSCEVCLYAVGDEYLKTVGMSWSHRWRNVGFFCVYICFNVFIMVFMYDIFRVRGWNPLTPIAGLKKRFSKDKK